MADLSIKTRGPSSADFIEPARVEKAQGRAPLALRRAIYFTLVILSLASLALLSWQLLAKGSQTFGGYALFLLTLPGLPWIVAGFWNSVIGFFLLHCFSDTIAKVAPFWVAAEDGSPFSSRVAILMTIRNEDSERAVSRLAAIRQSVDATGEGAAFDYFLLSDTDNASIAEAEERCVEAWRARFGTGSRLFYRRRDLNAGFKAGNIRDFLDRWGGNYELMLTLDADSAMGGDLIVKMARAMEKAPRLGILQSLVVGTPATSAFTRAFQFGMRHSMRSYTMGSTWWMGDCGPYWGHNAMIRVKPFKEACELPALPGSPPLGGPIISHDQIEAAFMTRAGYEVRVLPVEGQSYEDNPPALMEFARRDVRWCQGNMQYLRLLGWPNLRPISRMQVLFAIIMYIGSLSWVLFAALAFAMLIADTESGFAYRLQLFLLLIYVLTLTPKLAGLADTLVTASAARRYGGRLRLLAGALTEAFFSLILAPILTLRAAIFMAGLPLGLAVRWDGQQRDPRRVRWAEAARCFWFETAVGFACFALLASFAPDMLVWPFPMLAGLVLSIPFAVLSASSWAGRLMTSAKLCAIPEEFDEPSILDTIRKGRISVPAEAL